MRVKSFMAIFGLSLSLVLSACGGKHDHAADTSKEADAKEMPATADESGPEYTSAYICPMHCPGSGSADPGKCPACGMDYVKNDPAEKTGHEGHSH